MVEITTIFKRLESNQSWATMRYVKIKYYIYLCGLLCLLISFGNAHAALTTIGTANYQGSEYKLIWDDDNNGNSVVWLDYSTYKTWSSQMLWVEGLKDTLTDIRTPGYNIIWGEDAWRLPATIDGLYVWGCDGATTAGYNITNSEMGHLYYEELGNLGAFDHTRTYQLGWGLENTGEFTNLINHWYWSGTKYELDSEESWRFSMYNGYQSTGGNETSVCFGMAVRNGEVVIAPVPIPSTIFLLWVGLIGVVRIDRKICYFGNYLISNKNDL